MLSLCVLFCSVYCKVFIVNTMRFFSNNGIQNWTLFFIFQIGIGRGKKRCLNVCWKSVSGGQTKNGKSTSIFDGFYKIFDSFLLLPKCGTCLNKISSQINNNK